MKITLIQDFLRAGGTERQTVGWAYWLARTGNKVTLITFRPGGALEPETWPEGIRRISLQRKDRRLDWFAPGLVDCLHESDADCIVCMGRMANSHGWSIARSLREIPIVATFRTGKWLSPFYAWSLRAATGVMVNSDYARNRVEREARVPAERVRLIRNPVLVSNATHPIELMRERLRRKTGAHERTAVLISCAQFRPEKNHAGLVELAARFPAEPDWQLWLVGSGKTEEKVRERVRNLGLESRVHFWGFQPDPSPWMAAADIAVRTSRSDSLSNFLIESQWAGLPVVTTRVGGADECMIEGESGWIMPPDDPEALTRQIFHLINDPDLRDRASLAARTFARREFDPDTQFRKQTDFLRDVSGL